MSSTRHCRALRPTLPSPFQEAKREAPSQQRSGTDTRTAGTACSVTERNGAAHTSPARSWDTKSSRGSAPARPRFGYEHRVPPALQLTQQHAGFLQRGRKATCPDRTGNKGNELTHHTAARGGSHPNTMTGVTQLPKQNKQTAFHSTF